MFLQVDAHNAPVLALYRRAGFQIAWPDAYWQLPAGTAWARRQGVTGARSTACVSPKPFHIRRQRAAELR